MIILHGIIILTSSPSLYSIIRPIPFIRQAESRYSYRSKIETTAMLSQRQYDALWNGTLRFVPAVVAAILCLSIVTLSLSAVYGI